jgi:Tfp pilus assembly protein PilF
VRRVSNPRLPRTASRAIGLWREAFEKNPHLTDLALNLGRGLCTAGDAKGAREVVERALQHNPDSRAAIRLRAALSDSACTTAAR